MRSGVVRSGILGAALGLGALVGCGGDDTPSSAAAPVDEGRELLGGEGTVFDTTGNAFAYPLRNLSSEHRDAFSFGDHLFNRGWVPPGSPSSSDNVGLGPTYNATSCSGCHFKDGRGAPPEGDEPFSGLLVRLSVPGTDAHGGPVGEPSYGGQFNHLAIPGVPAEGDSHVTYTEEPGTFADGEAYSLRKPAYTFTSLAFGPFAPGTMFSPRVAPGNYGLGLLEAVAEPTVLALADEKDADGDGISGRPNYVWNARAGKATLGRFGWKANQPTLEQQTAGAFLGDIGATSSMNPDENCPPAQKACLETPSGKKAPDHELTDVTLAAVTAYGLTLAVPARRNLDDAMATKGEKLFASAGCASCHTPKLTTGDLAGYPELSRQKIRPYTDMLLHDMGDALADGRPDYLATGNEWRTPPLWGVGLVKTVNKHQYFLHDGRARGFAEAILWHGGEGARSRDAFKSMPKEDRAALVRFLESL